MSVWICRSVQLSSLETRQRSYLWVPVTAWRLASLQCAVEQISQGDITCKSGLSTPSDIVHQVFYVHLRLLWWEWAFRALLLYDGTEEREREREVWDCACLMVAVAQLHLNCMQLYLFFLLYPIVFEMSYKSTHFVVTLIMVILLIVIFLHNSMLFIFIFKNTIGFPL